MAGPMGRGTIELVVLAAWARYTGSALMGDSLAVELPALDRAALVRIQVPQPAPS
jgi:hypothetical protein